MYYTTQFSRTNQLFNHMMNDMKSFETKENMTQKNSVIGNDEQEYKIELALPGVKKEDLKINIVKNKMTISLDESCESVFISKDFKKGYSLPKEGIDTEMISAKMENGILTVIVPKVSVEEFTKEVSVD